MTINNTYKEITSITLKLIELGLSIQQNFPYRSGNSIFCKEGADLAAVLKNVSYEEKFGELNKEQNYNVKLVDGALLQMMYSFNNTGRVILTHRLAYFPAPNLINYEDDPLEHEHSYFGDSEFHDIIDKNVIKTPLRFDFSSSEEMFVDIHHPYCHLHLGEYETCRIPVKSPITPAMFSNFILRNFYNTALREYCEDFSFRTNDFFQETITENESLILNLSFE